MKTTTPDSSVRPGRAFDVVLRAITLTGIAHCLITAGASERIPWERSRVTGSPNPPAPYAVTRVLPGIQFDQPVDLGFIPGTRKLLVAEQRGRLWTQEFEGDGARPILLLDWRDHHQPLDSTYAFAFHPGFATNRFLFLNYNEPGGRAEGSFVARVTFTSIDPPAVDPDSERVILRWLSGGHNGCTLAFGNDGFLYISTGDGTSPDPPDWPYRTGQDVSDLLSSILRIDVDHRDEGRKYAVPPDNPFVHLPGARPEVWAFGLRNPWRMSFDRATGDLWVGDVGWEQWEMIYRVQKGGNYGWSLTEGPNTKVRTDVALGPGPILPPLVALPHTEAASITGGVVYHGGRLPGLRGAYVYGDWETGKFWALRHDGDRLLSNQEMCDTSLKPVSFTLTPDGELLFLDYNGGLYEFTENLAPPANLAFPRRLSRTGLFDSLQPLRPAPGTVGYRIPAPMWSDHATAEWLLGVPGKEVIVTEGGPGNIAGGTWFFPTNTVLARTLSLDMVSGEPASRRRIETQLLHWEGQSWNPYSYRWNEEQTDAELVPSSGTNIILSIADSNAPGGRLEIPWRFDAQAECKRCHNVWAGETLTLNWAQLSGIPDSSIGSPVGRRGRAGDRTPGKARTGSALDLLIRAGVLRVQHPPPDRVSLANPYDTSQGLAARARSWLHVNCSNCHRFGAGGGVPMQLNIEQPIQESRAWDAAPLRGNFGLDDARVIAPGDPWRSVLMWRMSTEGWGHMPLIGSRLADVVAMDLIQEWIRSLGPAPTRAEDRAAVGNAEGRAARPFRLVDLALNQSGAGLATAYRASVGGREFRDAAAAAATRSTNAFVRDLFQRFLPPEQRRQVLGDGIQPESILSLKGDARRGREIFLGMAQCTRCHAVEGQGRAFGPELRGLKSKYDHARLLDQILHPSDVVAPEYRSYTATLNDGSEWIGFIVRRTEHEIVLRDETLAEHRIAPDDVKELRESALSAMPEGMLAPLTAQEAADLLEYLIGR